MLLLIRYEKKSTDYLAFAHTTSMLPNLTLKNDFGIGEYCLPVNSI
jgi:hypothetical protein